VYSSGMRTLEVNKKAMTATKEDYIRAIYILEEVDGKTGVTKIADRLKLNKSTVSERVKDLAKEGLVVADHYTQVSLTKKGLDIGKKLTYKHRIIEVFLHDVLHIDKDKVHREAEVLEHAFSDEVIQRLTEFLNHPSNDPHGSAIPKIKDWNLPN